MKLRLLENEDHLFDAGLYLGFVGTIVSLILASLGMINFSLMAAYSSTSFGIIFVSHLQNFPPAPRAAEIADAGRGCSPEAAAPAPAQAQAPVLCHVLMNRSILIVICDFLLLSLLTFSTLDIKKMDKMGRAPQLKPNPTPEPQATQVDGGQDLGNVMKLALNEERKGRDLLQAELAKTREAVAQQQAMLDNRDKQVQAFQQELESRQHQALLLQQQQAGLQQQYNAAQSSINSLNEKLHDSAVQSVMTKEQLAAMQAEAKKQSDQAAALQKQLADLAKSNQVAQAEKDRLAGRLQLAEVEKRSATELATRMQEEVKVQREQNAKLTDGMKTLAGKSSELAQEIRENRPLAPNTIFNDFLTNRVEAQFYAFRPTLLNIDSSRRKETETVLVTDGISTYALCHVQDTPLVFWKPGVDWDKLTGMLVHNQVSFPITSLSFHLLDPRIILMPVTQEQARRARLQSL